MQAIRFVSCAGAYGQRIKSPLLSSISLSKVLSVSAVICHPMRMPMSLQGKRCRVLPEGTGASERARSEHPSVIGLDHWSAICRSGSSH